MIINKHIYSQTHNRNKNKISVGAIWTNELRIDFGSKHQGFDFYLSGSQNVDSI